MRTIALVAALGLAIGCKKTSAAADASSDAALLVGEVEPPAPPGAPPCMQPLACPPGTRVVKRQCTRADGIGEGPGHSFNADLPVDRYGCWELRNGKLHGTARQYSTSGALHSETDYVDGVKTGRFVYYDERGAAKWESSADGRTAGYYGPGRKKYEGVLKPTAPGAGGGTREGRWTRWSESGEKQFECDFVANKLSGECFGTEGAKKGVYDDGRLVSGVQVMPFFVDKETPIAGIVTAPARTVDVKTLLASCAAWSGQAIRVTGTVVETYACPSCPPGASCKPCFGDYVVLGGPADATGRTRDVAVVGDLRGAVKGASVVLEGSVNYSPGDFAINPCMVERGGARRASPL